MNSTLEVTTLRLIGKLQNVVVLTGKLENSTALTGILQNQTMTMVGKLQKNQSPYYATSNEYGTTIYIG